MTRTAELPAQISEIGSLLAGATTVALTGAGMSTDSGIPDYRGPDSPPRNPMTYQQFVGDADFRRRYWARNHVGWRIVDGAQPNVGHRALATLEHAGVLNGVITQNVDLLHTKAGSRRVVDLHGTYAQVVCLRCGYRQSRYALAETLEQLNPEFTAASLTGLEVAPDADAIVDRTEHFRMVDCPDCTGMLKPDIVYFGENVPRERVDRAFAMLDDADALLVAGSSLTVMSGFRFVRHAAKRGKPVVIINRGDTRGDDLATRKLHAGCSEALNQLVIEFARN